MVENCTLWMRKEISNLKKGLRIGDLFCTPPWIVGDSPTIHPKITPAIEMLIGDSLIANFLLSLIHMIDTTLGRAKENARKQIPPQGVAFFGFPVGGARFGRRAEAKTSKQFAEDLLGLLSRIAQKSNGLHQWWIHRWN